MGYTRSIAAVLAFLSGMAFVSLYGDLDALLNFKPKVSEASTPSQADEEAVVSGIEAEGVYLLKEETLIATLTEEVIEKYQPEGHLQLKPLQRWGGLRLPSQNWEIEVTNFSSQTLKSQLTLSFKVYSEGKLFGHWQYRLKAELWEKAYVAKRQINAGSVFSKADFDVQLWDTLRLRQDIVPAKIAVHSYQARQSISANKPLYWRDVIARSIVHKGEMVQVVAQQGLLHVNMRAKALEDGALGDVVVVRNVESNKRIQAEVIDENKVRVYF